MKKFCETLKENEEEARLLLATRDSRSFLKVFFSIKKSHNSHYSYAVFAQKAGISKSLPRDIIEGEKRLTEKTLPNFLKAMELDGLVQEFFIQLVKSEKEPDKLALAIKIADLFIDNHFNKTYTDNNFQDYKSPFLYAASGQVGKGSTLKKMSERTGIPVEKVKAAMPALEKLKLGQYISESDTFIPVTAEFPKRGPANFLNGYHLIFSKGTTQFPIMGTTF